MSDFHPFGRPNLDPYVSTVPGNGPYEGAWDASYVPRVDVRDLMDTMVAILRHPDYKGYRMEFLEALGISEEKEEEKSG